MHRLDFLCKMSLYVTVTQVEICNWNIIINDLKLSFNTQWQSYCNNGCCWHGAFHDHWKFETKIDFTEAGAGLVDTAPTLVTMIQYLSLQWTLVTMYFVMYRDTGSSDDVWTHGVYWSMVASHWPGTAHRDEWLWYVSCISCWEESSLRLRPIPTSH